jgi:hypothetical protein
MERKIADRYLDHSYGFPVLLLNVELVKVRGTWTPVIDYQKFAKNVVDKLCKTSGRFSGNHVRFIRQYFEMTLKDFASTLNVTHPAVMKWEKASDNQTGMHWSMEKDIRLLALKHIGAGHAEIGEAHTGMQNMPFSPIGTLEIEASPWKENQNNSESVFLVYFQKSESVITGNQTLLSSRPSRIHINTAESDESKEYIVNGVH